MRSKKEENFVDAVVSRIKRVQDKISKKDKRITNGDDTLAAGVPLEKVVREVLRSRDICATIMCTGAQKKVTVPKNKTIFEITHDERLIVTNDDMKSIPEDTVIYYSETRVIKRDDDELNVLPIHTENGTRWVIVTVSF